MEDGDCSRFSHSNAVRLRSLYGMGTLRCSAGPTFVPKRKTSRDASAPGPGAASRRGWTPVWLGGGAIVLLAALSAGWLLTRGTSPHDGPIVLISIDTLRA